MKKGLLILTMFALSACSSQSEIGAGSSSSASRLQLMSSPIAVDTTDVDANSSLSTSSVSGTSSTGSVRAYDILCTLLCLTPSLTLIGSVTPPMVNAASLQASDVTVNGTKAYVAYNIAGAAQAGGVDVIDFSTPGTPVLKSSTTYASTDVNKLYIDSAAAKLYITGNTSSGATGAILYRVGLDSSGLPTAAIESKTLRSAADATVPAYAGTGITKSGNYIYVATGINGGLSVLNASDLSDSAFTAIPGARDVQLGNSSNVLVLSGQTASLSAQVQSASLVTGAIQTSVLNSSFTGSVIDDAKASLYSGTSAYLATGGQAGAKYICNDGSSVGSMPIPSITGLSSSDVAANSITFGNGIVYVAQGAAGIAMYSVQNSLLGIGGCAATTLSYVGRFSLGARASANNVFYSNGYLIVATGYGGFQIIQVGQSILTGLLLSL